MAFKKGVKEGRKVAKQIRTRLSQCSGFYPPQGRGLVNLHSKPTNPLFSPSHQGNLRPTGGEVVPEPNLKMAEIGHLLPFF